MIRHNMNKPFQIDKSLVYEAWKQVAKNQGAAGVDKLDIEAVEKDKKKLLYKLWNRMSSGSYQAMPIRKVEIPKADGKTRTLGIPTVLDRVAQMAVVNIVGPRMEKKFHEDSYGYRPKKSAHHALEVARRRCLETPYVVDLDIKGFFDNIPHDKLMEIVEKEVPEKWIKLYIERWLKSPMQDAEGNITERNQGTPQGGVVSPLLANMYLDVAFDQWMAKEFKYINFERYADDIIIHCRTLKQAKHILQRVKERLKYYGLEVHPEKTKIVYCRQDGRNGAQPEEVQDKFDFLGYGFRARTFKDSRTGLLRNAFLPAISDKAVKRIKEELKATKILKQTQHDIADLAVELDSRTKGWINYYGKFRKFELLNVFSILDNAIIKWIKKKYKMTSERQAYQMFKRLKDDEVFAHFALLPQRGQH